MSFALPQNAVRTGLLAPVLLAGCAAAGALAVRSAPAAAALVFGLAAALIVFTDFRALPLVLVGTIFVESVSFGEGLTVGRLAGALALGVVTIHLLARETPGLRPDSILLAGGALFALALASAYWAADAAYVFRTIASFGVSGGYILACVVLIRNRRHMQLVFATFVAGAGLFGLISIVSYVASGRAAGGEGLQGDQNYFALYQAAALPLALALAAMEDRAGRRSLLFAVVGVIVISVAASLSRGGLVALAVVVLATLVLPARLVFGSVTRKVSYALMLATAGTLALLVGAAPFLERFRSIFDVSNPQADRASGRIDLWRAAWRGFLENPFFGLGAGNFQARALDLLQTTPGVDIRRNYATAGRVVHNSYLEVLTELGIIGFALFLAVLGLTAWRMVVIYRRAEAFGDLFVERSVIALALAFVAIAVGGLFLSLEYGRLFWLVIGLVLALDHLSRQKPLTPAARLGPAR
ncbi:MAG: O-antigen ligase family protein [Actinobacteria bacterium]|nr:O-antigen ligase family protein [Actinomycetota bacterium]